ncbi:hypothetical protein Scep_002064 [Stephania cephalantha]|uniref:Uncharacterized protein n=1 Tax=Stephania cephalantha TaxID=152367 RepID=A0AAP0L9C5_9MAGN
MAVNCANYVDSRGTHQVFLNYYFFVFGPDCLSIEVLMDYNFIVSSLQNPLVLISLNECECYASIAHVHIFFYQMSLKSHIPCSHGFFYICKA